MPRIRTIKPEFFRNETLSELSAETHLLAAGLLCCADDEGYFDANPKIVAADVFPLRECSLTTQGMLSELSRIEYIRLGETSQGKRYGHVLKFNEHQRVNRPTPSKIKTLTISWETHPELSDYSVSEQGGFTEDSSPEGKGKEGKGKEVEGKDTTTTTYLEDVAPEVVVPPDAEIVDTTEMGKDEDRMKSMDQSEVAYELAGMIYRLVGRLNPPKPVLRAAAGYLLYLIAREENPIPYTDLVRVINWALTVSDFWPQALGKGRCPVFTFAKKWDTISGQAAGALIAAANAQKKAGVAPLPDPDTPKGRLAAKMRNPS